MYIIYYVNKKEFITCTDRGGVSKALNISPHTVRGWFRNGKMFHYIKSSCIVVGRSMEHIKSNRSFSESYKEGT